MDRSHRCVACSGYHQPGDAEVVCGIRVVCGSNHSECVALLRFFGLRARVVDFFAAGEGPVPGAGAGGKKRSREGDDLAATADASCDDPAVALQRW